MIEKTVFKDLGEINKFVKKNYGFSCDKIEQKDVGSANCYRLCAGNTEYFMKEFQSKMQAEDLTRMALT